MIITVVYTVEAVIKILAFGFVFDTGSYLRNPQNIIDFFSLIISLQSYRIYFSNIFLNNLYLFDNQLGMFKVIRAVRILNMSRHFKGLQIVLISLGRSFPMILNLLSLNTKISLNVLFQSFKFIFV